MRVLFWSETYWPRVGGVETLAVLLLAALRARGFHFEVVTWGTSGSYEVARHDGIAVHRFPFFEQRGENGVAATMQQVAKVARLKRAYLPDLVHLNSYGRSAWFHTATSARNPRGTLLSLHQSLPDTAFGEDTLAAKILRGADAITCCSRAVYEATARRAPGLVPRMQVIPNAVPPPALEPTPLPQPPTILFVGRLAPEKGLDWALTGLRNILRTVRGARLLVVGDGPLRRELEQRVAELGLREAVEFLGDVPSEEVPRVLQRATLVVIPSLSEGFGLVALEAALMGRPVVATRVGGLPEVVCHAETGWLVRPGDADALATAVRFLIEHPAVAHRMGEAARARAMAQFSWERYVDAFEAAYRQLAPVTHAEPAHSVRLRG